MAELPPEDHEQQEASIDMAQVVGRLGELGVEEDLTYLFDEEFFDDDVLMGEIVMLATMYDLDIDELDGALRGTTPIETRTKNEFEPPSAEIGQEDNNEEGEDDEV